MKILLIVPTFQYKTRYPAFLSISDFPVGFAYLSSALKAAGHEVFGLNPNNDTSFGSQREMIQVKIRESLKAHQPELVCLGGLCTDYAFLRDALSIVRAESPGTPVVMGGGIINNDAEDAFNILKPDFCIRGEGEEIVVALVEKLAAGSKDFSPIPNLGYWDNGTARFTKLDFHYGPIDQRAFPDYELFGIQDLLDKYWLAARNLYRYPRLNPRPWPLVAARSCPFSCTFCVHNRGVKYRARSIENIIQEIEYFYPKYHFNILLLLDELFAVNSERLRQFSAALLKLRAEKGWEFNWTFQTHASAAFDDETLAYAKTAGCYFFSYGMESASPTVLASMNKRTKPDQVLNAIRSADKLKIGFGGNFIFGDPAENPQTLAETLNYFRAHCTDLHVDIFSIRPYPGSKLFDVCVGKGLIGDKSDFYEHIDENPVNMTANPKWWWNIWIMALDYLGGLHLWIKSTKSVSCDLIKTTTENPVAKHYGMQLYDIAAVCPHCSQKIHLQEMSNHGKTAQAFTIGRSKAGFIYWLWQLREKRWFFQLCYFGAWLTSFMIKPFGLLLFLKNKEPFNTAKILTGCPQCNKRFRLEIG